MYLSKIPLAPQRRQTRRMLGSPQVMHAMVMRACTTGSTEPQTEGRVLWRVDRGSYGTVLYLVSPSQPWLNQIIDEACLSGAEVRTADYGPFLERLADGQSWAFRLTANPVHSELRGPHERGKRYGHVTPAQQAQWLSTRASKHGFELIPDASGLQEDEPSPALVVRRERPVFRRRRTENDGRDRVTINRVTFEGALRVSHADTLRRALVNGIGPSKAYGCGLLTLASLTH